MGGFAGGGFFGGGGHSSQVDTTTTTAASTSQAQASGDASNVYSGLTVQGGNLELLDQGAIAGALELARVSLGFAKSTQDSSAMGYQDLSKHVSEQSAQVADAFKSSKELAGAVNAQQLILAVIAAAVVVTAFIAFRVR